ncbi:MAG: hypothetical protein JNK81_02445 [Anaerolineales bacterium]|nr:hypothetical protein [Anaerolineales bacterium]
MDGLTIFFLIGLGISLITGSLILIYKRKDKFSLFVGLVTLKPVLSAILIFSVGLVWLTLDISLFFGYTLIACLLLDFLVGIALVFKLHDVILDSWLAVLIYALDAFRWLNWQIFLVTFTDFIGIIELVQISLHGFIALVNLGILFLKSKQINDIEIETTIN